MEDSIKNNRKLLSVHHYYMITFLLITNLFIMFGFNKIDKQVIHTATQVEQINQHYNDLVYENEVLWKFIENLDTYKNLDDAVYYRDNCLPDYIQFIDE